MSNTFCPLPWIHLAQKNNGHFRVCCYANKKIDFGVLKQEGKSLTSNSNSIEEIRNSTSLKEIRKKMLNGVWSESCQHCQTEELSGIQSPRLLETEKWNTLFPLNDALKNTFADGQINTQTVPLHSLDLRLGNVCNLKCRMCGPTDSRSWYSDYRSLYQTNKFRDTHGFVEFSDQNKNDPYLWFRDNTFWFDLLKYKNDIKTIYLVGGEPLLIDEHFVFLENLAKESVATNIEITYNTNLSVLKNEWISLWRHFKRVNFGVSLDGLKEINDYIRGPHFSKTIENLSRLDRASPNISIWLSPTVQIYNVLYLPDFIRWGINQKFHFLKTGTPTGIMFFHPLHSPEHLSIQALPKNIKNYISNIFLRFIDELMESQGDISREILTKTCEYLNQLIVFMENKETSHLFPQFLQYTQKLDKIRSQNFGQSCAHLASLFKEMTPKETHT